METFTTVQLIELIYTRAKKEGYYGSLLEKIDRDRKWGTFTEMVNNRKVNCLHEWLEVNSYFRNKAI